MGDTLLVLYLIIGVGGFGYSLFDEAKKSQRSFAECNGSERGQRLTTALFMGVIGYPLAALVGSALFGVAGGLIYISVVGIARLLGLA